MQVEILVCGAVGGEQQMGRGPGREARGQYQPALVPADHEGRSVRFPAAREARVDAGDEACGWLQRKAPKVSSAASPLASMVFLQRRSQDLLRPVWPSKAFQAS